MPENRIRDLLANKLVFPNPKYLFKCKRAPPWLKENAFLARILQDPCKNAITCKILQGNLFLARSCKEIFSLQDLARKFFPCKILQGNLFLARSCKVIFSLQDFSEMLITCMIFQKKHTKPWKCKEQKTKILNCQSFKLLFSCVSLSRKQEIQAKWVQTTV